MAAVSKAPLDALTIDKKPQKAFKIVNKLGMNFFETNISYNSAIIVSPPITLSPILTIVFEF
jgi:hypothetical protein